ncbi:MAG: hypothetical protein ACFFD4_38100 [Candidatus Odinarchaeota archaeon]
MISTTNLFSITAESPPAVLIPDFPLFLTVVLFVVLTFLRVIFLFYAFYSIVKEDSWSETRKLKRLAKYLFVCLVFQRISDFLNVDRDGLPAFMGMINTSWAQLLSDQNGTASPSRDHTGLSDIFGIDLSGVIQFFNNIPKLLPVAILLIASLIVAIFFAFYCCTVFARFAYFISGLWSFAEITRHRTTSEENRFISGIWQLGFCFFIQLFVAPLDNLMLPYLEEIVKFVFELSF